MALSNAETKVRRAALSRLAKDVDLKALTIAQRMELLKSVMQSRESELIPSCGHFLLVEFGVRSCFWFSNGPDRAMEDAGPHCTFRML